MKQVVSAAAIINNDQMQVLLAERSLHKRLDAGLWETIGGRVEPGESPQDCLKREIREEIGCEIDSFRLFNVYSCVHNDVQTISVVYIARIKGALNPDFLEISRLDWFDRSEAEKLKYAMNCRQRIVDFYQRTSGS